MKCHTGKKYFSYILHQKGIHQKAIHQDDALKMYQDDAIIHHVVARLLRAFFLLMAIRDKTRFCSLDSACQNQARMINRDARKRVVV